MVRLIKKVVGMLVFLTVFSPLGCDGIPLLGSSSQEAFGSGIGFAFGRLLVSALLSGQS